jgi:hypothetical protein
MAAFRLRPAWWVLALLSGALFGLERPELAAAQAPAAAPDAHPARYPFDPVCPWGRVADGHGLLVRCLESSEARGLLSPAPATPAVAADATAQASSGRNPGVPAPAPPSTKLYRKVSVKEVGPAQADTGELPDAQVQLRKVLDRYVQCVNGNGGLEGPQGKVTVRFLVRERGRAEGVSVKDRQGVSLAAAKCVAEVVDRRFVGYPAAPIVGATLSIEFMPEGGAR